jgi:hypothetical protein
MQYTRLLVILIVSTFMLPSALLMSAPTLSADRLGDLASVHEEYWNGQNVIDLTEELCEISADNLAYRVSGSEGADQAADLISERFQSYGLQVTEETYDLPVWNLLSKPSMVYDVDANPTSVEDDLPISSFQAESYSVPTASEGAYAELVTLPLPNTTGQSGVGMSAIDTAFWDTVNVTGKVLLIGREVRWATNWEQVFKLKILQETPSAIIFRYNYSWMSYADEFSQSSTGGRPLGTIGPVFWDRQIPVGSVNYSEGRMLADLIVDGLGPMVRVQISSIISEGHHRNIIAEIPSTAGTTDHLVIGAHYDTVLCEGYIDNTAGVATILEIARTIQTAMEAGDLELKYGLRFVAFAGEELGLTGSINYVCAHQQEIDSILAVMIIDSIGSRSFKVTDAFSNDGIDLNGLVDEASEELGVMEIIEEMEGSDHMSFMYPEQVALNYNRYWGVLLEPEDPQGVPNSLAFYSSPILVYDNPNGPFRGHIHTASDSRSGVESWIDLNDLKEQAGVIALTTIYAVSADQGGQDNTWIYIVLILLGTAAVITFFVLRH